MKHTDNATQLPPPSKPMRVAVLSDDIASALKLENTLRHAGASDVICFSALESLQLHLCEQSTDLIVGEITHEFCNGLGIPDVLKKKMHSTGKACTRPHLLWIGKASVGAPSDSWDDAIPGTAANSTSAAPAATRKPGRVKLLGGVPLSALRLYGKLLRAAGIQVAICEDGEKSSLAEAMTALVAAKRTQWEALEKLPVLPPTEDEVVEALATGHGLRVVFQPQFRLSTGEIVGAEALVRWRHPRCGDVSPALFVQMAERLELDLLLFSFVKAKVIDMLVHLRMASAQVPIAVNASVRTLCTPALAERMSQRLHAAGLAPELLKIELTEDIGIDDLPMLKDAIPLIQAKGIPVSLDDFGSRGSTPLVLCKASFDEIKIDASLVHSAAHSATSREVIRAVVNSACRRRCRVVAEGIESEAIVRMLQKLGCEHGQGYFISAPLEADAFFNSMAAASAGQRAFSEGSRSVDLPITMVRH